MIVAAGYCDKLGNTLVSGIKNDAITPDRGDNLDISADTGNGTNTLTISDAYGGNFNAFLPNTNYNKVSVGDNICLKEYWIQGSANGVIADVALNTR